jgi:hypothetical protein
VNERKDGKECSLTKRGTRRLEPQTVLAVEVSRGGELIYQYTYIYSYKLYPLGLFLS